MSVHRKAYLHLQMIRAAGKIHPEMLDLCRACWISKCNKPMLLTVECDKYDIKWIVSCTE
jgi:hypothetical protein